MKTLTILISGRPSNDNLRDVEIQSGTTVREVLEALEISDYLLSPLSSDQHFAPEEVLYPRVENGMKLKAVPDAEVGI